jgi:hypothetical protein
MKYLYFIFFYFISLNLCLAQMPFNTSPFWQSSNFPKTSTGCAWADINNDGWLDLVVANGNDMNRQNVTVYFNNNGTLAPTPGWQSSDVDYHGHVSVGDVNNDGWIDVAVSVYLGAAGFGAKGKLKIYLNHNGVLDVLPSWVSADSMYTFCCSLGDADNDGYLDLAAACGENYSLNPDQMRIYKNVNGVMQTMPYWKSSNITYAYGVDWADINKDGKLDLVFACEGGPNLVYLNYGDSLGHTPYWTSTDASQYANSLFLADVNNDGNIDLAISDNMQSGGTGRFKIYLNTGTTLSATPFWSSSTSDYGSGITLADVDFDGWKDLICGGWWTNCWIYKNNGGTFSATPQWTSSVSSVVEAIKCADYNNDGLDTLTANFTADGIRKLFYLERTPVHKIVQAKFGSTVIPVTDYCINPENGWISFKNTPGNSVQVSVRYISSHSIDFAVSNWDNTGTANFVYKNTRVTGINFTALNTSMEYKLYQNFPNPFNPSTRIKFSIPENAGLHDAIRQGKSNIGNNIVTLKVYDILGREVVTLINEKLQPGTYETEWNGSASSSGVYFYTLITDGYSETKKMMLQK